MSSIDALKQTIAEEKKRQKKRMDDEIDEIELEADEDDEDNDDENDFEIMESISDALYSSNGKTIADVVDGHLSKMCKILLVMQKQQAAAIKASLRQDA